MNYCQLDAFTRAYIECALWSSVDPLGEPLDANYDRRDLAPATMESMVADCKAFQAANADLLAAWHTCGQSLHSTGHDFWLTRNHHGAGFWDRFATGTPGGVIGDKLTAIAHACGEVDLTVGDDGRIY